MPKLLATDLSTNVGWALLERGRPPTFGTERLPPAMGHDQGARFDHLLEFLNGMRMEHEFDAIAYERPILPRKSGDLATTMETLTLLWGLCTIVQLFAHQERMPCIACPVEQAKITLTGSKLAKKDDMVRAAMTTMNWKVADDHQADAGAVGVWAFDQIWPKVKA